LSIDVDHFKKFNDNHGHDAGDVVLRAVGEALQSSFRDDEVPCRFGGEEFVVVLPGVTASVARKRAEQLRAKIEALTVRYAEGNLPKITISVGIATYPHSGSTPVEVLKVADEALYVAKHEGRNRVQVSPGAATEAELQISVDEDVRPRDVAERPCCRAEPAPALVAAE
jgi:diguanylate cyclase (GGDEF)-like protein